MRFVRQAESKVFEVLTKKPVVAGEQEADAKPAVEKRKDAGGGEDLTV